MNEKPDGPFRRLVITDQTEKSWHQLSGREESKQIRRGAEIGNSATLLFSGLFPMNWPYAFIDGGQALPWHDEYWKVEASTGYYERARPIVPEIRRLMGLILATEQRECSMAETAMTFVEAGELNVDNKARVQSLSVESMIAIDRHLIALEEGRHLDAIDWLATAYERIIDASMEAVEFLGNGVKEGARKAAHARHKEHATMRDQVFEWCGQNLDGYQSLDSAADALATKIRLVPVRWRTYREWIGQYRRTQRSARKP